MRRIIETLNGLISARFSLENPKYSLSDPGIMNLLGPDASDSALALSAVFRAISLISGSVGKLPCTVYRRTNVDGQDGKERDPQHQAYRILRYEPNEDQTQTSFREVLIKNVLTWGNGYAWIIRDERMRPVELILLSPQNTKPYRRKSDGALMYMNTTGTGKQIVLFPHEVLHVKNVSDDGIEGLNVLQLMCRVLRLGQGAQEWAASFFANSCTPSSVLSHPETLKEEAQKRLRRNVESIHQGGNRAHKMMILEEGMTFSPLSFTAKDSQMVENVKLNRADVANFFGVPPHKLGDDSRTSFSSLEQENQSYLDEAVDPWLVRLEQEYRMKLFTEAEKETDSHVVEFNRNALVRADLKSRMEAYSKALAGAPFMVVDEVRARENLNPLGGDAAEIQYPINNFGNVEGDGDGDATTDGGRSLESLDPTEAAFEALDATRARLVERIRRAWDAARPLPTLRTGAGIRRIDRPWR
jgi:HK97 family phage portal protein